MVAASVVAACRPGKKHREQTLHVDRNISISMTWHLIIGFIYQYNHIKSLQPKTPSIHLEHEFDRGIK